MAWLAAALADVGLPRIRRELQSRFGERADVRAIVREGPRIRLEGIRIVTSGAEVVADATLLLGTASLVHVEAVRARITIEARQLGAVVADVTFRGDERTGRGIVANGVVSARLEGAMVPGPLTARGRVLVDETRAYLDGGTIEGPGLSLRVEGSAARDGTGLRGRGRGGLVPAALGRAARVAATLLPRTEDAFEVVLEASGSVEAPTVAFDAKAVALGFRFGQPRWVPAARVEDVTIRGRASADGIVASCTARAGAGRIAVDVTGTRATVTLAACPARWMAAFYTGSHERRATVEGILADGTVDAKVAVAREGVAGCAKITVGPSVVHVDPLRVEARDARGTRIEATLAVAQLESIAAALGHPVRLAGVEDVLVLSAEVTGARAASFRSALLGGDVEGRATIDEDFRVEVRAAACDARLLVFLAALGERPGGAAPRIALAPAPRGSRARGIAWLPPAAEVTGSAEIALAGASVRVEASMAVRTDSTDLSARVVAEAEQLRAQIQGRLGVGEAIDLGLFDGGAPPEPRGTISVSLALSGPARDVALSAALSADVLVFAPEVAFEDVRALLWAHRGVAVWNEVHARAFGGRVELAALVDREGPLGGMRGWVRARGLEVARMAEGRAAGALSAELVLEQHGPDTAPVLGEGTLVVEEASVPEIATMSASWLPVGIAERNASARGRVTARLNLDASSLRLLDIVVPLTDGRVDATMRVGFEGSLEAHAEVHLRELVTVPLRVRGSRASAKPEVDVDVLATALAGLASARATRTRVPSPAPPRRHAVLDEALAAVDWAALLRRATRQLA